MSSPSDPHLDSAGAALLIIDVQERLAAAMPTEARARCERQIAVLIELARRRAIPVVVSEQYPKGLGQTVAPLAQALGAPELQLHRFEKKHFACTDAPEFQPIAEQLGARSWLLVGMEAHVCVYLTARALAAQGPVAIVADAVCSRREEDRRIGLALAERAGAAVTTTETVVFDALGCAGTDDFRALSKLLK